MYDKTYFLQKIMDGDESFLKRFEEVTIRRKVPKTYTCDDLKKLFAYEPDNEKKESNDNWIRIILFYFIIIFYLFIYLFLNKSKEKKKQALNFAFW